MRTDTAARAAVEAGGVDRVALIARHDGRVVAVAGLDGLREPQAAEVAFAVADDWQGRGTGMRMLEQLAEIAAERGVNRFDAEVLFRKRAMLGCSRGLASPWLPRCGRSSAPSSVADVGAAATPGNLGRVVLANIVAGGFEGR